MLSAAGIDCVENNVPSNVVVIAEFAAEVLGTAVEELVEQVESNFERVFRKI